MPDLEFKIYDVFTETRFAGNPLAVFLDAPGIDDPTMQGIANELNLSETVFITGRPKSGEFEMRIFTPQTELPFAGHPTVGTALALRDAGLVQDIARLNLPAGTVEVAIDGRTATFRAPLPSSLIDLQMTNDAAAELLGLAAEDIKQVEIAAAGVPFACIELASRVALANCSIAMGAWKRDWSGSEASHIYVYCCGAEQGDLDARMFAPAMGIAEDPATGGAAAAMAAILPDGDYRITQGEDMGRKSLILLSVRDCRARIGGAAVQVGKGEIHG
ncbi:PhzF family phenazine biosynthesis protein [Erythrobacter mangrovi]|uniref:PhzF family phenazine biosynthesis protein n=1 Tax=Erythrobacter mangrovi TaxID=2739433 RepID=A0A7D4BMY4_9SPHN|nr:PhzF family phenazine biosynthesis protein [Erythrobacter mangrovi]QKG70644.1 PhzF family phenazine biosynthesis protein [Erythrobacter mangrovi]